MEEISDDVFERIKDFDHLYLTEEQTLLINRLILNEELKGRYKDYGLCNECKQPKITCRWCQCKFQRNFNNWTSGNHEVDNFIQKFQLKARYYSEIIEWIDYDRFENIEYLSKGGFGTTSKAIWKDGYIEYWDFEKNRWKRGKKGNETYLVALKCLHNSQDITAEFLKEIESHITAINSHYVTRCHGFTKDSESNNFMMVMEYVENGSLRQYLNNCFNSMKWDEKLDMLRHIVSGLDDIHKKGVTHHNFHSGNILKGRNSTYITDLGLYQPANVKSIDEHKKVYGVLPYIAPEILRGEEYTQESDIYGFGIVAYEVCTGLPPYHDIAHDAFLAISICQGQRPKSNYKIPRIILDTIKQCWDAEPSKRPKANELYNLLHDLCNDIYSNYYDSDLEINKQIEEVVKINEKLISISPTYTSTTLSYITNSRAIYTSRLLDFKDLPEPKNAIDTDEDGDLSEEYSYSESKKIGFYLLET
ncbi:kinase-like domain-containing protein [Rhizophagus clarus]|uniref:Kinase-like domain-containing protein n=1 Tax=Rhizophagus clarus TaxID=94130 RepID=A0A8H3QVP0_9GLOM|nr:kinase-like domain-containing protein [Rhizophagus clarus]